MSIKSEPKVAVLVLNYNGKHHLGECLQSLKTQNYGNYEVFVVDNSSRDGSLKYIREAFPWVRIIAFDNNLGFSKAYNKAVKTINSEFIAFLNNDTKVHEAWLKELILCILEEKSVVAVGSKMLLYKSPHLLNHAGTKITQIGGGFSIGAYEQKHSKYNVKKFVGGVCGGAMLVSKSSFLETGLFDEQFFSYFEDVDLCWRFWLRGFKVMYCPKSVVYHKLGGSWGQRDNPSRLFQGQRNRLIAMIKNLELKTIFLSLIMTFLYDFIELLSLLGRKNIKCIKMKVKAYCWITKNLRLILQKRLIIQRNRVVSDKWLLDAGLMASLEESVREYLRLRKLGQLFFKRSAIDTSTGSDS